MEFLKLAEMYTSRSHVLNYVLYKVLAMKVNELRSTVREGEDIDALHSENKDLRAELAFSEEARARAIYDITKTGTIQRACVQAQRTAESQLRACQNMIHAKDKELTEALTELSRAKDLLANLGVPGYADPKGPTRTYGKYIYLRFSPVDFGKKMMKISATCKRSINHRNQSMETLASICALVWCTTEVTLAS
ncbi:Uncharacterized protein Fot_42618 [Forsythia ovata]|uniref:Uncharacterized protein n=1 Tax=Forsythia ovata TaxID=205694 RepID=A0ABD1RMB6_9LAMI